ncbi:MAG: hypothetical protein IJF53_07100 [Clostridia bacterium]|nr:hypothetical protein [Clostridia bacterium]
MNDLMDIPMREYSGRLKKSCGNNIDYCIKIPVIGAGERIDGYYARRAEILEARLKGAKPSNMTGDWRIDGAFYVTYISDRLLSVSGEVYEDRGLLGDRLTRLSEIWDLRHCRIVPLLSLARSPAELMRTIREKTMAEMKKLEAECPGSFYSLPLPFYDGSFLTENGIAWWHRRGRIAPRSGGIPTFTLAGKKAAPMFLFDIWKVV